MVNNLIIVLIIGGLIGTGMFWAIRREKCQSGLEIKTVRKMAVAGSFYPAESEKLAQQLDGYLKQAEKIAGAEKSRILIVPHAGTIYSGRTAGAGFGQIANQPVEKVIILGVSHKFAFKTAESVDFDQWETPLGNLQIHQSLIDKLRLGRRNEVHETEHSLEMQTIWIKKLWPEAKIVPILVSQPDEQTMNNLAFWIAGVFDDKTLMVVSTDLSHYFTYGQANNLDGQTINRFLDGQRITSEMACGAVAMNIAYKVADFLQSENPRLFKYENSGDTAGDKDRVVGYAAVGIAVNNPVIQESSFQLTQDEQKEAVQIARKTLDEYVNNRRVPQITTDSVNLNLPLGAFVTLKKDGDLRGCIGEFDPDRPLWQVIIDKTMASATKDTRFDPVKNDELSEINIEISVLTPRKKVESWEQVRPGIDGVIVTNGNRSGTFLPQVAVETGWSKKQLLEELCRQKAGLPADCYLDPKTEIYVYQAQVF